MSAFIDAHRDRFGVEPICRTLDVSASAYHQRARGECCARAVEDERLLARIRLLHAANCCAYGYGRKWNALRRAGEHVPRCQVQRLMRTHGIVGAKRRGRPWRTTRPDPLASHVRTTLVLDALRMALGTHRPGATSRSRTTPIAARNTRAGEAAGRRRARRGVDARRVDRAMRRRLSRRSQLVRSRTRAKNEIHAALIRRLQGRSRVSDLFGAAGRRWLAELVLGHHEHVGQIEKQLQAAGRPRLADLERWRPQQRPALPPFGLPAGKSCGPTHCLR